MSHISHMKTEETHKVSRRASRSPGFYRFISCCVVNYSSPVKVGGFFDLSKMKVYSQSKFSMESSRSFNDLRKIKIYA